MKLDNGNGYKREDVNDFQNMSTEQKEMHNDNNTISSKP